MRFPILSLVQIRGMLFVDVAMTWFGDDLWFDPDITANNGSISSSGLRLDEQRRPIGAEFWNSDGGYLQDGRASFGWGFQFFFLGGLQFNWVWSQQIDYEQTAYAVFPPDQFNQFSAELRACTQPAGPGEPCEGLSSSKERGRNQMDFYIAFDW